MKASSIILTLVFGFAASVFAQEEAAIRPDAVGKEHVGKKIAVEGRVYSNSKTKAGIHLYFAADSTSAFQAVILAKSIYKFQVDVAKKYDRRNVRVTGKVEVQDGKYYIRIEEPSQIKTVAKKRESN